jgi:hypothetical protein
MVLVALVVVLVTLKHVCDRMWEINVSARRSQSQPSATAPPEASGTQRGRSLLGSSLAVHRVAWTLTP